MENKGKLIVDAIVNYNKKTNLTKLKQMRDKLIEYNKSTELTDSKKLDDLVSEIAKQLPEDYARKFISLEFYEEMEDYSNDDLPF